MESLSLPLSLVIRPRIISVELDLASAVPSGDGGAWLGFCAATGDAYSSHQMVRGPPVGGPPVVCLLLVRYRFIKILSVEPSDGARPANLLIGSPL